MTGRLVGIGRLFTAAEVEAVIGTLAAERDEAWFEVSEHRADLAFLRRKVAVLVAAAADHPSEVERLTAECTDWAARCGAAEVDLDHAVNERDEALAGVARLRRQLADVTAERDDLAAAHARLAEHAGAAVLHRAVTR